MTRKPSFSFLCTFLICLLITASCSMNTSTKAVMSFVPPAPKPVVAPVPITEAPAMQLTPALSSGPLFLSSRLDLPPRPSVADMRVRRAEQRFATGERLYKGGDLAGARKEFDGAIELLLTSPESLVDRAKVERKLEELAAAIHRYDVNGLGAGDLSGKVEYDKAPLEDILERTFPVDPKMKPKVKEQLQATVSQLPLEVNDAVLSYINYFSSDRGRRTLLAGLKRAGRYKPMISRILAEEGVPQELIYLAQAESGFLPRAVSNKAAVGMWQFVKWRGQQYGLMQTGSTDDRLDPEKATRSAARHLKDLYHKFGDWYLAIAGYNCGDGCVERAVQRTGYADFWQIRGRNAIPRETTNYVPIIVAMTLMHKNAKDYGLEDLETDPPLVWETMETEAPTHLALVADVLGRPISELRDLNPSLLTNIAPAGHALRIPEGSRRRLTAGLEAIPASRRASWRVHKVGEGETLQSIAKRYKMPPSAIAAANHDDDAAFGDVLVIPTSSQLERLTAKPSAKVKKASAARKPSRKTAASRRTSIGAVQRASLR